MAISDAQYLEWLKAEGVQRVMLVEAEGFDPVPPTGAGTLEGTTNLAPAWPSSWSGAATQQNIGVVAPDTTVTIRLTNALTTERYYSSNLIQLAPSTTYTFSFNISGTVTNNATDVFVLSNTGTLVQFSIGNMAVSAVKQRKIFTFTTSANITGTSQYIRFDHDGNDAGYLDISDVQLEQKPYATAFTVGTRPHIARPRTFYMASMPYISAPSDTPANQPYDDAVTDTPKFNCALSDVLEGYTVPSWGDIVIDNSEFSRDAWLEYGWDGRAVSLLFGDPAWRRADFRPILTGTIAGISAPSSSQIKMSIKDRQWELNKPIQTHLVGEPVLVSGTTYRVSESPVVSIDEVWDNGVLLAASAYTTNPTATPATFTLNAAPVGRLSVEYTGGAAATGDVIPLCYGEVFNITPKVISTALLRYQVHDGPVKAIVEVRDNGIPIAFTADLANGKFTLLSKPVGTVTCDVQGATSGGVFVEGVGRIARYILLTQTAMTSADLDNDSLSDFVNLCTQRVGIYVNSRRNTLDVLDELIKSVGGFYTPNRQGKLFFGRIDPTLAPPLAELGPDDIAAGALKVVKQSTPWQTARVAYLRNGTVQTTVAGAVSDADKTLYAQGWQYATRTDPSVKTAHLLASEPDAKQTCLVDKAEAGAESERLLALHSVKRTTYSAELIILPLTLNMGDVVRLTHNRYGLSAGKVLYVVGITESIINRRVTLTLWG